MENGIVDKTNEDKSLQIKKTSI